MKKIKAWAIISYPLETIHTNPLAGLEIYINKQAAQKQLKLHFAAGTSFIVPIKIKAYKLRLVMK